jgi:hypothetical protein
MNTPRNHPALWILLGLLVLALACACALVMPRSTVERTQYDECTADWLTCFLFRVESATTQHYECPEDSDLRTLPSDCVEVTLEPPQ